MITLNELIDIIKDDRRYALVLVRNEGKEKALNYLDMAYRHVLSMYTFNLDHSSFPKIKKATARQRKKYKFYTTWIADSFSVAMNKLYGITIEEGKEYTTPSIPWGVLTVNGKTYPVYSNDPGQCDFIILNGEHINSYPYSFNPEGEFIYHIINHIFAQIEKEIKGE